jgi:hypothetical protein
MFHFDDNLSFLVLKICWDKHASFLAPYTPKIFDSDLEEERLLLQFFQNSFSKLKKKLFERNAFKEMNPEACPINNSSLVNTALTL